MVVTTYCYISGGEWLLTGEACRVILCKTKFPSFVIKYFCLKKKKIVYIFMIFGISLNLDKRLKHLFQNTCILVTISCKVLLRYHLAPTSNIELLRTI